MRLGFWLATAAFVAVGCGGDATSEPSGSGAASAGGGSTGGASTDGGASAGGGASGGAGTGGASTGGAPAGGAGGGGDCVPACAGGLECCAGTCVNKGNDIKNCGACGTVCQGPNPFCDNGTCGMPPCDPGSGCGLTSCCGSQCCMTNMICCVVPAGPVGPPTCVAPNDKGTCEPGCPDCVCLSPETPIATPSGDRQVASLVVGNLVFSIDGGTVRAVPIARVNRVEALNHRVVRATLANGRIVEISGRHPTADGRQLADLRAGDTLHGVDIVDVTTVAYAPSHTYDILPASDSGAYFAAGALVGSTLASSPTLVPQGCFSPPP